MADETPTDFFYAVLLHPDGTFATEKFDTVDALAVRLKELINRDVSVSCFKGVKLNVSKPPMRYLMTPDANVPLFNTEPTIEADETGYLGVDPAHLEGPPQLVVPTAGKQTAPADEFFSDDDDDAINIFDNALPDPDT